jgi:ABC-2 type transport system ATP-binding protein
MSENAALRADELALAEPETQPRTRTNAVAPVPKEALVSFRGVWRYWGRGDARWAVLRDVTLDVAPGTAVCVGGRNGAGKTTLLRIATGILAADEGRVTIDGISAEDSWREYHRRIGFLSAGDRGLYARVSVRGHLDYWAALAFVPRSARKAAIDEALVRFGLEDLAKRRTDRLSQGQRQRLRLALTLVHRPKVVLLDEPRNSLDDAGLATLAAAIDDVLGWGGSVIWCSPAGEGQPVEFDRTFMIEDGELRPV